MPGKEDRNTAEATEQREKKLQGGKSGRLPRRSYFCIGDLQENSDHVDFYNCVNQVPFKNLCLKIKSTLYDWFENLPDRLSE